MIAAILASFILVVLQTLPSMASSFCYVKETRDGFVALRSGPSALAPMVGVMKADDEVMIRGDHKGSWVKVTWWRSDDRLVKGFDKIAGKGWVNRKFIDTECG